MNIDYIVETYCVNKEKPQLQCNGKCHLAKQLSTTITDNKSDVAINNLAESFFPVFYLDYSHHKITNTSFAKENKVSKIINQFYSFSFEHIHFRPPIV